MTRNYILTDDAANDMRGLIRYTRETWGAAQARRYADDLEKGIIRLADDPAQFRDMSELYPTLRGRVANAVEIPWRRSPGM